MRTTAMTLLKCYNYDYEQHVTVYDETNPPKCPYCYAKLEPSEKKEEVRD